MHAIGVEVAPEHGFGRSFLEGISQYAASKCDAQLHSLGAGNAFSAKACRNMDGLILRLLSRESRVLARRCGIPVVDIYGEVPLRGIAQVHGDYRQIAQLAATLFLSRNYKNIGWCGISGVFFSTETERHFTAIMNASGRTVLPYNCSKAQKDIIVCNAPDRIPDGMEMRRWLRALPKPCAVFCCNDHRAFQLMRVAIECGISVPEEIAVLGVDNDTTICAFSDVPISSIDPDAFRLGQTAMRTLNAMIGKRPSDMIHRPILVPPKCLVERRSTQHFPISPAWLSTALVAIERNLSNGIGAMEVVSLTGLSAPTVERKFREKFGMSIIAYITDQRMKRAQALIETTDMMIKQIAAECGFSSQQYFCRTFKSRFGYSPGSRRPRPRTDAANATMRTAGGRTL